MMGTVLLTLGAFGEMLVGVVLLAFPREVAQLLVDVALDARGSIVARMLGCALLALGLTWWMARGDAARLPRLAAGFILYNAGIGALFGWAALGASQPLIPWLVCVMHAAFAIAFAVTMMRGPSVRPSAS